MLEPLRSLRVVCDAPDLDLSCDLVWTGVFERWIEPRHYSRKHGRVVFDTSRFAQNGRWSGSLRVGDETFEVTPDRWWGARDRSWGVRPVGEPEPAGAQTGHGMFEHMFIGAYPPVGLPEGTSVAT